MRLPVDQLFADVRSRRRRTIGPDQPTVAGRRDVVDAVSFPVTPLPADDDADDLDAIEAWFRRRVDIEEPLREAKPGAALRPLPSATPELNAVGRWPALLAGLRSVTVPSRTRLATASGRARAARLRFPVLRVPARVLRHTPRLTLRLPAGRQLHPRRAHPTTRATPTPARPRKRPAPAPTTEDLKLA